jgi:hypothetical protein
MPNPTCDADCTDLGWTEALIDIGMTTLHVSHPSEADLDGAFKAFCHDSQEMLRINGWLMEHYELIAEGGSYNAMARAKGLV